MQTSEISPATPVASRWIQASLALTGIGWLLSAWLLAGALALAGRRVPIPAALLPQALCSTCEKTLGGASSWQLGVPLGGWGLLYFAAMAVLILIATAGAVRIAYLVGALGTGVSLLLAAVAFASSPICAPCLLVHAANLGLVLSLWFALPKHDASFATSLFASRRALLVLTAFAVLTGALAEGALWTPTSSVRKIAAEYNAAPRVNIPLRSTDPVLGPRSAPVRLVIFSSFQCPACKGFAGMVHRLHEQYPNDLAIVFKNFPLDNGCNPSLKRQMQPRACAAAFAAEAANQQNAFWQYHDKLFASNLREGEADLRSFADGTVLDSARWDADRASPATKAAVISDVAQGIELQLNATPSIFLDDRPVKNFNYPVLQALVEQEIQSKSTSPYQSKSTNPYQAKSPSP